MVVGRLLSYWEGNFSGAMLNFGGVNINKLHKTENESEILSDKLRSSEEWQMNIVIGFLNLAHDNIQQNRQI